jgi:hypothetical protein
VFHVIYNVLLDNAIVSGRNGIVKSTVFVPFDVLNNAFFQFSIDFMNMIEEAEDDVDLLLLAAAAWYHETASIPQHISLLSGHLRYLEIMNSPNSALFHDEARMDKSVFIKLLALLSSEQGQLQ